MIAYLTRDKIETRDIDIQTEKIVILKSLNKPENREVDDEDSSNLSL